MRNLKKGIVFLLALLCMAFLADTGIKDYSVKAAGETIENGEYYLGDSNSLNEQYKKSVSGNGTELIFKKDLDGADLSSNDALFAWISGGNKGDTLVFRFTDANNRVWETGYALGVYDGVAAFAFDSFVQNESDMAANGAAVADFSSVKDFSIVIINNSEYSETEKAVYLDDIYVGTLEDEYITNGDMSLTESSWPYMPTGWEYSYTGGDGWSAIKVENGGFIGYAENSFGFSLSQTVDEIPMGLYSFSGDFRIQTDATVGSYIVEIRDEDNNVIASEEITEKSDSYNTVTFDNLVITEECVTVNIIGSDIKKTVYADNVSLTRTGDLDYETDRVSGDFSMAGSLALDSSNKNSGSYGVKVTYFHDNSTDEDICETVHIEAEDFISQSGIEIASKVYEGSQFINSIGNGDSATYNVELLGTGNYTIGVRASTTYVGGVRAVKVYVDDVLVATMNITSTGAWSTFNTFLSEEVYFEKGIHTVTLEAVGGGYNINWIEFIASENESGSSGVENGATIHIEAEDYTSMSGVELRGTYDQGTDVLKSVDAGDYMIYTVDVEVAGNYIFNVRAARADAGTSVLSLMENDSVIAAVNIESTGGWSNFSEFTGSEVYLSTGTHTFKVYADGGRYNLNWYELVKGDGSEEATTEAPVAGDSVHIEAEDYTSMSGVALRGTYDQGTDVLSSVDAGDYMLYTVDVPASGTYRFDVRAARSDSGVSLLSLMENDSVLATVNIASTGGWGTFAEFKGTQVYLTAGAHTFKIYANGGRYNLNWYELTSISVDESQEVTTKEAVTEETTTEELTTEEVTTEETTAEELTTKEATTEEITTEELTTEEATTVYVPAYTGGYDLVVTDISWGGTAVSTGTQIVWNVTIMNDGDTDIPSGTTIGYQVQVDGDTTDITWCDSYNSGLKAGQSIALTCNGGYNNENYWTATNGTHSITAWVDDVNRLASEVDENNNMYTITLAVPSTGGTTGSTTGDNIEGKTFFFLGSSVTYGYTTNGVSFVDYIAQRNNCTCVKEAVSGTTLVDNGSSSYVQRMINNLDANADCDHFICQLSTNDASQNLTLGSVSSSYNLSDFDTSTIIGAMEYIICYAKTTWNCPVSFYTGTYYDNSNYQAMVDALYQLQDKWGIGIIDLWNNEDMRNVSSTDYNRYMADSVHPTAAGYLEWWTPVFEEYLQNFDYSEYENQLSDAAKAKEAVLSYFESISGSKTVIGIHNREPNSNPTKQTDSVIAITGQAPALWSGDFLYSSDDVANRWSMIYECENQWNNGSIVQIMFHVAPPTVSVASEKYGVDWTSGSNAICSSLTDSQWNDLITDGGSLNTAWKARLDEYAVYLKYLQGKGIPVIVRPFHEMNQGVFWWGGRTGYNGTQALYRLTRDYFENDLGLDNLIWVWDMQDLSYDWDQYNPGTDYWDILAVDFYNGDGYTEYKYNYALSIAGDKMIAIGECDKLPTSSTLYSQPRWVFCMSWAELTFSYNSNSEIQNLYWAENVIVRNELPDFD